MERLRVKEQITPPNATFPYENLPAVFPRLSLGIGYSRYQPICFFPLLIMFHSSINMFGKGDLLVWIGCIPGEGSSAIDSSSSTDLGVAVELRNIDESLSFDHSLNYFCKSNK